MAKQPDLGITDPYQLNQAQFDAAIALLEELERNDPLYWGVVHRPDRPRTPPATSSIGTTWPFQVNSCSRPRACRSRRITPDEGTTGWSDTWMMSKEAEHPNCMLMWMDHMMSAEANAQATVWFGEAATSPQACAMRPRRSRPGHCEPSTPTTRPTGRTSGTGARPQEDCADDDAATTCVTQDDWVEAWTTLRGS